MKKLFLFLFLMLSVVCSAQEDTTKYRITNKTFMFNVGNQRLYNNYLSPLLYKGTDFRISEERLRYLLTHKDNLSSYYEIDLDFNLTQNPVKTHTTMEMSLNFYSGVHYRLRPRKNMNILLGSLVNFEYGYQTNNGNTSNNAFFQILDGNLWLSGMIYYHIPLRRKTITIRDHISMPFVGFCFAPHLNQLYTLSSSDMFSVTSLDSHFHWKNKLTVDVPFKKFTLRAGLLAERSVFKIVDLERRNMTVAAIVGVNVNCLTFRGNSAIPSYYRNPIY